MKKWTKNLSALLKTLGFSKEKIQDGLTAAEWKQVRDSYMETYGTSLEQDKTLNEDLPAEEPEAAALTAEETAALVAHLAATPEVDEPAARVGTKQQVVSLTGRHTKGYLFGIEQEQYSRKKWYNELMANPAHTLVQVGDAEAETFSKDFKAQARALRDRMNYHRVNGTFDQLNFRELAAVSDSYNESFGNFTTGHVLLDQIPYSERRTDLVLAYFKSLPSVRDIFPVRSNVQNLEVVVGNVVGELSQSYRSGRVFKGSMEFGAEVYKVDDLMFKFNFEDLVALEKMYIGYLNKDHSAIIKWTFIEWVMVYYGEQLLKEQNERNVIGMRLGPWNNISSNPAQFAADGVLTAIVRTIQQRRVLPFYEIGMYTAQTMLDVVEAFADKIQEVAGSAADNMKIYLNARHKRWYIRAYRAKYGQDADFTGSHATLVDLDPSQIIWVPNMRAIDYWMWATEPGNIELLEDKPGEMLAFSFHEELEGVAVVSRWKEGAHVVKSGKKFYTIEALEADNFRHQFLFVNWPVGETVGSSSLVSADALVDSSTATIDTFWLVSETSKDVTVCGGNYNLYAGIPAAVVPALDESNGSVYADGWFINTPNEQETLLINGDVPNTGGGLIPSGR